MTVLRIVRISVSFSLDLVGWLTRITVSEDPFQQRSPPYQRHQQQPSRFASFLRSFANHVDSPEWMTTVYACLVLLGIFCNIFQTLPGILSDRQNSISLQPLASTDPTLAEEMAAHDKLRSQIETDREMWKVEQQQLAQLRKEEREKEKKRKAMAKEKAKWEKEMKKRDNLRKAAGLSDAPPSNEKTDEGKNEL